MQGQQAVCSKCGKPIDKRSKARLCRGCWLQPADFTLAPEQAAYIAGLFDGEAHIAIKRELPTSGNRRKTPAYKIRVEIAMTDPEAVEFVNGLLPQAKVIRTLPPAKYRRLPMFRLRIIERQALSLLKQIVPYLRIKGPIAEGCLKLNELRHQFLQGPNTYGKNGPGRIHAAPPEFIRAAEDLYWAQRNIQRNKLPRHKRKAIERFL